MKSRKTFKQHSYIAFGGEHLWYLFMYFPDLDFKIVAPDDGHVVNYVVFIMT